MVKKELKRISIKDDSSRLKNIIKHSKRTLYQYHVLKGIKNTNDCRIKVLALIESYYSDKTLDEIHPEFHALIYKTEEFEQKILKK